MAFTLHPEREKATNNSACELISLVQKKVLAKELPDNIGKGSWAEVETVDWTEKKDNDTPSVWRTRDENDEDISVLEQQPDGSFLGFTEDNHATFKKFIDTLYYKNREISRIVTAGCVTDLTFQWVLTAYKGTRVTIEYLTFLKEKINLMLGDYKYYFVVSHLHIEKPFRLGNVDFEYYTDEFFEAKFADKPNKEEKVDLFRKRFRGKVFACYSVHGIEKNRAEEIAYEECCKAVDVLKLYSPTAYQPKKFSQFDIDRRVKLAEQHEFLSEDLNDKLSIYLSMVAGAVPHTIKSRHVDLIQVCSKNFSDLISISSPNELQTLVINALGRFSATLSQPDFNERVADIFAIWESLLLKDKKAGITESLHLYGGFLLKIPPVAKADFQSYIDHMYDIRCDLVHHGFKKPIAPSKMLQLQRQTIDLMENIIVAGKPFQNKKEFIEGIDATIAQEMLSLGK